MSRGGAPQALALAILPILAAWSLSSLGADAGASPDRLLSNAALWQRLATSPFGEPLYVESEEQDESLRVNVYGLFHQSFTATSKALTSSTEWCEFTPLHNGISACVHGPATPTTWLTFHLKARAGTPLANAYEWRYGFRVMERSEDYVRVELDAPTGPLDTRDFRIVLEAVPHADGTLVQIRVSYQPSALSKTILSAYTNTFGRRRQGFTVVGQDKEGKALYARGRRALFERVVMRGYLALEAYLDTLYTPEAKRFDARLERWLELTQRYPRQLHDIDREDYLRSKRREREQQRLLQAAS